MRAGLFLDRDGVINVDTGHPHRADQIEFVPGIFDLVRQANRLNYFVAVITNQAGIAKGLYSVEQFTHLSQWMKEQFKQNDAVIDHIEYCPHHPDGHVIEFKKVCSCRKPLPGMIRTITERFPIDLTRSALVGDRITDMQAGFAAGVAHLWWLRGAVSSDDSMSQETLTYRASTISRLEQVTL